MKQLPLLGLSLDTEPTQQPENTYRFALNMLPDSVDGSQGAQSIEFGNKLHQTLDGNVVGIIPISIKEHIVFTDSGCIYIVNEFGSVLHQQRDDFDFSTEYPITGQYTIQKGCEGIVYWRDGNNPDRYYNFVKPDRFNDLNDFSINPNVQHPDIEVSILEAGGNIRYGAYSFVIELLDKSYNVIYRSVPSDVVYITPHANINTTDASVGGRPTSSQSVRIELDNVDMRFDFVRIGVLYSTTADGITVEGHYVGDLININQGSLTYTYRGFNETTGDYLVDKDELLQPKLNYTISRVMEQVQGKLVRGNLIEQKRDYSNYQKYASKIGTKYVISYDETKSEQGDEVIAKAIVYLHEDGTLSPPFHIPGRSKLPHDSIPAELTIYTPIIEAGISDEEATVTCEFTCTAVNTGSPEWTPNDITQLTINYNFSEDLIAGKLTVIAGQRIEPLLVTKNIFYRELSTSGNTVVNLNSPIFENNPTFKFEFVTATHVYKKEFKLLLDFSGTLTFTTNKLSNVESWTINNTAVKDATPETGYVSSGLMGYYEVSDVYENPPEYCGNDFWGVDVDGNALLGTPIRHHRMPDRYIEPIVDDNNQRRYIGVKHYNIEYPADDIVGHFFVTNVRTPANSTVSSSGIMAPFNYRISQFEIGKEGRYAQWLPNQWDDEEPYNTTEQNLITHEYLVDKRVARGSYIKTNGYYRSSYSDNRPEFNQFFAQDLGYTNLEFYGKHHLINGFSPAKELIPLVESWHIPARGSYLSTPNYSYTSDFNILSVGSEPSVFAEDRVNWNYIYMKNDIPVHTNLFSIIYRLSHSSPLTLTDDNVIFNGDVFISRMDMTNVSYMNVNGGNLFESTDVGIEYELLRNIIIESPYNMDFRLQGTDCNVYFDATQLDEGIGTAGINLFMQNKTCEVILPNERRRYKLRDSMCPEWYGYNKDFSKINDYRKFTPLLFSYDYCSKCLNKYPNRIIWSETQSEEQLSDSYRIYKPLSYFDIPAHRGEISDMNYKENNLLVRTDQSSFLLQPNPQSLQASGTSIYLGTGDFLHLPPMELMSTDLGYAGQQHILDSINTPQGLVWIDQNAGKIFNYTGQLEEISRYKMYHWFDNNLKSELESYFRENGYSYNKDQFGCRLSFDPKTERLLIHKVDYKPLFKKTDNVIFTNGKFRINGVDVEYTNPLYFENKSFTISYSMRTKTWLSWHSYQPDFMYYNANTYFSVIGNQIWSHDDYYKFGNYYGISFPHIIEYVDRHFTNYNLHSIYLYTTAQQFVNGEWIDNKDLSFGECLVYTRHQSTGKFTLTQIIPSNEIDTIDWSNTAKPLVEYNNVFRIGQIRDLAKSSPVNTSNWSVIQNEYINGQGYIDKVPNTSNLELNRDLSDLIEFRDTYAHIRLYYNNDNHKLTMHIFDSLQFESI